MEMVEVQLEDVEVKSAETEDGKMILYKVSAKNNNLKMKEFCTNIC